MKNIKKNKLLVIIISLFTIITIFLNPVSYASSIGEVISGGDSFIQAGESDTNPTIAQEDLKEMSDLLYNTLLILAIIVAVIIGLVIGIKFMMGNASDKAKIKETLVPYIAGCVVAFGAFAIWKIVVELLSSATA